MNREIPLILLIALLICMLPWVFHISYEAQKRLTKQMLKEILEEEND